MTGDSLSQPKPATPRHDPPLCVHCDADLSCGACGVEQPYTDISIAKAEIATLTSSLTAAEARLRELTEALKPFAKTGWMTGEIEHTARTVVAHMYPGQEYETVLSSDDFKRARDLLAALSQTEEGRG